jgi:hypothetical protein
MSSIFFVVKICAPPPPLSQHTRACASATREPTHVDGDEVDLRVPVLARLRRRHLDDLARAAWIARERPRKVSAAERTTHP